MSSSPSIVSEDFSPNESPTFPLHSIPPQPPLPHHSPTILKTPGDKPREKKFVNLMDPVHILDSAVDFVGRNPDPSTVTRADVESQNTSKSEPFSTFTIEPEHDNDDSRFASYSHFPNQQSTQNNPDK